MIKYHLCGAGFEVITVLIEQLLSGSLNYFAGVVTLINLISFNHEY